MYAFSSSSMTESTKKTSIALLFITTKKLKRQGRLIIEFLDCVGFSTSLFKIYELLAAHRGKIGRCFSVLVKATSLSSS